MSTTHPNFLDKLAVKIYPGYLYQGQLCVTQAITSVAVIHLIPDLKPHWKIMDFIYVNKNSAFRFLGLGSSLKMNGDVQPLFSILQTVYAYVDERKSEGKQLAPGDLICTTPFDRQFFLTAPESFLTQSNIMQVLDAQHKSLQT